MTKYDNTPVNAVPSTKSYVRFIVKNTNGNMNLLLNCIKENYIKLLGPITSK